MASEISAGPYHGNGHDTQQEGNAKAAGISESLYEDAGIGQDDKSGHAKDEEAGDRFVFLHFQAIGEEVDERDGDTDKRSCHRKEGKESADFEDARRLEVISQRLHAVLAELQGLGELIGRNDAEDEEFPDHVEGEGNGGSHEDGAADFGEVAAHVIVKRGDKALISECREDDGEGRPGAFHIEVEKKFSLDVGKSLGNEDGVRQDEADHEEDVETVNPLCSEEDDRRKKKYVEDDADTVRNGAAG